MIFGGFFTQNTLEIFVSNGYFCVDISTDSNTADTKQYCKTDPNLGLNGTRYIVFKLSPIKSPFKKVRKLRFSRAAEHFVVEAFR